MSVGVIGSKHTVLDVYPVRNKKVLVLVDPHNILGNTPGRQATMSTIAYLLHKEASVVVASSFGPLEGITLNLTRRERESALEAFKQEGGVGYTNFFSGLPPAMKIEVLNRVPGLALPSGMSHVPNTGKTSLFASLTNDAKLMALQKVFPKREYFPASTHTFVEALQRQFPSTTVSFAPDCLRAPMHELKPGEVLVLENLRFYRNEASAEQAERTAMAEVLVSEIDIFVNDSFATSHYVHASNVEIPRLLQHGAAGQAMDRELAFYSKFVSHPGRPLAVLIGGTSIPEKLKLIYSLIGKVDRILVGGAVAFPFLAAQGLACSKAYSLTDEPVVQQLRSSSLNGAAGDVVEELPCSQYAKEILALCAQCDVDVVLPVDHIVLTNPDAGAGKAVLIESTAIPHDVYSMDCGLNTVNLFARSLRGCRTVFWTGTLGWASKGYTQGTCAFAEALGKMEIVSIAAGRHTTHAVQEAGLADTITHVSSGGVSCLEVLLGSPLPGLEALSDVVPTTDSTTSLSVNELLRHLPLFIGCNSHQMQVAARKFVRRVHALGDYIVCRGDRHTRMCVVAHGGFVARYGPDYLSSPPRFIGKGQTVGMYEFITQAAATETVRAAQNDTVSYQLSSSALNELLNAYPDLAAQLFQNIAEPLRRIANEDYQKQQDTEQIAYRGGCRTRVPVPGALPRHSSFWEDTLQDVVATITFQVLSMRYTPFVSVTAPGFDPVVTETTGWLGRAVGKIQGHRGLPLAILIQVLRNLFYHQLIGWAARPWMAAVASAVAVSPLRLMAYGITYSDMNIKLMLDEALYGAAVSGAPLVSYHLCLKTQKKVEESRQRRLGRVGQLVLMSIVRLLLGFIVFPIIYQRNFVYTQPSASRFWDKQAFRSYEVKQLGELLLRYGVHGVLKQIRE